MEEKPRTLMLGGDQLQQMINIVVKNPTDLFLSEGCRKYLALDRWQKSERHLRIHAEPGQGVMAGTVAHNRKELEKDDFGSSRRTLRLINPLSSLEPVYSAAPHLKVLSIGPRTEMELFHLMGVGFNFQNIYAVDLISSSPLIDTGDMHKLPYDDRSFHVVISSWVLSYSSEPQRAVDEMIRVCIDGGLLAIGLTYEPGIGRGVLEQAPSDIAGSNYGSVEELKALIGAHLAEVNFQQNPTGDRRGGVMIIARIKH